MYSLVATIFVAALSTTPEAPHPNVTIIVAARGAASGSAAIILRRLPVSGDEVATILKHTVALNTPLPLHLREGSWTIDVESTSLWHDPQSFVVVGGAQRVVTNVWPRSFVKATVPRDSSTRPIKEIIVRFESADPDEPLSGAVSCPIEGDTFVCPMPAGNRDLRVRPRGFMAHYRLNAELKSGEILDLGRLKFQEGQAVTGRVQTSRGLPFKPSEVVVTATPAGAGPGGERLLTVSARPEANGFFHIDGLLPGSYVIKAALGRQLHSTPVRVDVVAGTEAELSETLRLAPRRTISVAIHPATAPAGLPWRVALSRHVDEHQVDSVTQSSGSPQGIWESPALPPGRYKVSISTAAGDRWFEEDLALDSEDIHRSVTVEGRDVRGSVTLGETPLQASITFRAPGVSVSTKSDDEGRFVLLLPRSAPAKLIADVRSAAPEVRRRLRVELPEGDEKLTIALPNSVIMGEVVTADGKPVESAIVSIAGAEHPETGFTQVRTAADGSFIAHALATGDYDIVAASFLSESNHVRVEITDTESPDPVRLVIREMKKLRGRVVSAAGPVAAAQIEVRAVDVPQMMSSPRLTDAGGEFVIAVPPDARMVDLTVSPPGFSFTMLGIAVNDRPIVVNVDQRGGTVEVVSKASDAPLLVHNGATTAVSLIGTPRTQTLSDGSHRATLAMMEPGAYSTCVVDSRLVEIFRKTVGQTGGRCVSGVLPPYGSLTLDLRKGATR